MTTSSTGGATMPPGPRLPRPLQAILLAKYRHRWLPRLQRRYGDTFSLRPAVGGDMVVITDPDQVSRLFTGSPEVFHAGEGNAVLRPLVGAESVLMLDEERHLRMRRMLLPAFGSTAIKGYHGMFAEIAEDEVARWRPDRPFGLYDRMEELTMEVILRVVFGVSDEARLAPLRGLMKKLARAGLLEMIGWSVPALERFGPWRRYRRTQDAVDQLLYAEIADRRAAPDTPERRDVLSRMMIASENGGGLSDVELRDQLITLVMAGFDTTSAALAWTFHELAHRPAQLARAREAAARDDDKYLEAVVKETLRLRPVLPQLGRRLTGPATVGDRVLPAGVSVIAAMTLIHTSPRHHDAPADFRPERFLGTAPATGSWIPFGGGVRRCPGATFATLESITVLKAALLRYDLHPEHDRPETARIRNVMLVPSRGTRVVVRPRG
ncbi:cytochrome P450 [Amycolatopsis sp. NBC_01488]|uniref:cytochrome P450 n=1 Tax=Amycolatopsis sp. NBC_01488 TaxID=2903563 RepID=UPI002E28464B|nr:cytochrome P450 [Amycolatopsis sp. NBC_01488]